MSISCKANAKINLYLHVTGRRADGYHLLDSLVVFADIYDLVEVSSADSLSLEVGGFFAKELCNNEDNLIIKAAKLLAQKANIPPKAHIKLTKNLPVGAGIGGGSADAAATLKLLCKLWSTDEKPLFSIAELAQMALPLGADIPMCLVGKTSHISGIGEIITPMTDLPEIYLVLVNPNKMVMSKDVYNKISEGREERQKAEDGEYQLPITNYKSLITNTRNDLEDGAIKLVPEIADVLAILRKQGGCLLARMSGSGTTCFGLFETQKNAVQAAVAIKSQYDKWWVRDSIINPNML